MGAWVLTGGASCCVWWWSRGGDRRGWESPLVAPSRVLGGVFLPAPGAGPPEGEDPAWSNTVLGGRDRGAALPCRVDAAWGVWTGSQTMGVPSVLTSRVTLGK